MRNFLKQIIKKALVLGKRFLSKEVRGSLVFIFSILGLIFILLHLLLPLALVNALSDNFYKVAIGVAALITAYFGSSYFREELSRKKSIEHYRTKYPPNVHGVKYRIIESETQPGAIYLHDLETLHIHHIWNMKTVYDLGWQSFERVRLSSQDFDSILIGDPIRTRGELGE